METTAPGLPALSDIFPPPAERLPPAPMKRRRGRLIAVVALILVLVLIVGAGGSLAYVLTRPKPVIQAQSSYAVGALLTGADGTSFHVTGQQFSDNATVIFLLDGQQAPGTATVQSDAQGSVQFDVDVTSDWAIGKHMLTARDSQGYITKVGIPVQIVAPGVAGTPGPNGAPTDSLSFSMSITIQPQDAQTGKQLDPFQTILYITGQADPAGGTVCQQGDDGKARSATVDLTASLFYIETMAFTCTGHYQSGQLTYSETLTTMIIQLSNGDACGAANVSIPYEKWDGTFSSTSTVSGTFTRSGLILPCLSGATFDFVAEKGTWIGTR